MVAVHVVTVHLVAVHLVALHLVALHLVALHTLANMLLAPISQHIATCPSTKGIPHIFTETRKHLAKIREYKGWDQLHPDHHLNM